MGSIKEDGNGWLQTGFSDSERSGERKVNAFVGKGVKFHGTLKYNGTIWIDGSMEGEIYTDGCVLIGEDAVVTATITASVLVCKGKIKGNIVVHEKTDLRTPAVLIGSLTTPVLSIEEGVLLKGDVKMITTSDVLDGEVLSEQTPEVVGTVAMEG